MEKEVIYTPKLGIDPATSQMSSQHFTIQLRGAQPHELSGFLGAFGIGRVTTWSPHNNEDIAKLDYWH